MKRSVFCGLVCLLAVFIPGCGSVSNAPSSTEEGDVLPPEDALLTLWETPHFDPVYQGDSELLRTVWSEFTLSPEDESRYPALQAALVGIARSNETAAAHFEETELPEIQASYDTLFPDFLPFYSQNEGRILRSDTKVVSLMQCLAIYRAGSQQDISFTAFTVDPQTGDFFTLDDVVTDPAALPALLTETLCAQESGGDAAGLATFLEAQAAEDALCWTLGYQGLTFYFDAYELVPYGLGSLETTLYFADHPELFSPDLLPTAEAYAIAVPFSEAFTFDLDPTDDSADTLFVGWTPEEQDSALGSFYLSVNGAVTEDHGFFAYSIKPYLVHMERDGSVQNFLYLEALLDNDYRSIYVYDLSGSTPTLTAQLEGTGFSARFEEDQVYYEIFTDPTAFTLDTRLEVLGTMTGQRVYLTDPENGAPTPHTPDYTVAPRSFTLLRSLPVERLPQREEDVLPADTVLTMFSTDNASFIDFLLEDGSTCRVAVDLSDYPPKIDGLPNSDYFDGILYAG